MLRDYQHKAMASVFDRWTTHRSPLVTMATGTGKTEVFTHIAKRCMEDDHPVCVLVDRIELLDNAADRMYKILGVHAGIERGDCYAFEDDRHHKLIVGTFQTLVNPGRLAQFDPSRKWRLIVDEAHLSITRDRLRVMRHFLTHPEAKAVGFTATPDRLDGRGMGQFFDCEAFRYEIRDAIHDGWLVPIKAVTAKIPDLKLIPAKGADYSDDFIADLMEADGPLYATAKAAVDRCGQRKTLVFCARVAHAQLLAGAINAYAEREIACHVSGEMDPEVRKSIYRRHREGDIQFLCNVGVLTTGFDAPYVSAVVCARPTQSRALFSQMVGRGTRPLDVDRSLNAIPDADARRAWIGTSPKPDMLVVNCAPETGALSLVGPVDVLAGDMTEPEKAKRAREEAEDEGEEYDVEKVLANAEAQIERARRLQEAMAAKVKPSGVVQSRTLDLFARFGVEPEKAGKWISGDATRERLLRIAVMARTPQWVIDKALATPDPIGSLTDLCRDITRRDMAGLLSRQQEAFLLSRRQAVRLDEHQIRSLSRSKATELINRLKGATKEFVV